MQAQGSSLDRSSAVMVAAGPQDEQARALVQALRQAGLSVVFAETANIAARASEAAACVAVLRPDTWKSQAIATVMRARPDCLLPVLAEPMELPRGPWTGPVLSLVDDAGQGEQQLIQALRDYLATRPQPELASPRNTDPVTIDMLLARKKFRRSRRTGPVITAILLLIIVALGGLLGYRYYTSHPGKSVPANALSNVSTAVPQAAYAATVPGPTCDLRGGQWEQGDRYMKTVDGKKVEVLDKYTTVQCQPDGALVTRSGDYGFYSELFFDGPYTSTSISQHYFAQVDATIVAGDAQASLTMDVHIQDGGYTGKSYGRDGFEVNALGHWEANTASPVDGSPVNRLAVGFLSRASKTYTLAVEVNGPLMTFWINGKQVTSVTDTTYTDNSAIAFGVSDDSARAPISALFSHFKYEALSPGTLATPQIVATATAQAQANLQKPYTARIPGYNCDKGAGQWQPLADMPWEKAVLHCLPTGMRLTEPGNTATIGEEDFYWLNGNFPQDYKVSAKIDVSAANDGCAGLGTRADRDGNSYGFIICADGLWAIVSLAKKSHIIVHGWVNAQSVYTMTAESKGTSQSLFIDGHLIKTINDSHLKNTDHISLLAGYYRSSQVVSAIFSDFTFTPLA